MSTATRLLMAAALLTASAAPALASDHLASPETVQGRLSGASSARAADLSRVEDALSSPQAARAAATLGLDVRHVRSAAATLGDAELRDLAARAAALDRDPRSGLSHDVDQLLVIFLIVAIVVLVIKAVD